MASKDVCSPWPWKCSPEELFQALSDLRVGKLPQIRIPKPQDNLLERAFDDNYYSTPQKLPQSR